MRTKLTPPQLAKRLGVSPEKIYVWIRNGELSAFNAATKQGQRPRYLIDESDIADFERRRKVMTPSIVRGNRRPPQPSRQFV